MTISTFKSASSILAIALIFSVAANVFIYYQLLELQTASEKLRLEMSAQAQYGQSSLKPVKTSTKSNEQTIIKALDEIKLLLIERPEATQGNLEVEANAVVSVDSEAVSEARRESRARRKAELMLDLPEDERAARLHQVWLEKNYQWILDTEMEMERLELIADEWNRESN